MKAYKTEHKLVGVTGGFEVETFDHRSLRMEYLWDEGIIHVNEETTANTIAPWSMIYDYEPVDNYPEERL